MEHADGNSDSDVDFDQNELEVALYSQIHFDSNKDNETSFGIKSPYQRASQLFRIGVKELPASRSMPIANKPVFGGEFLAFSIDNCGGLEAVNKLQVPTSQQEKGELDTAKAKSSKGKCKVTGSSNLEDKKKENNNKLLSGALKSNETLYHSSPASKQTASNTGKLKLQAPVLEHVKDTIESSPSLNFHNLSGINEVQSVEKKIKVLAKEEKKNQTPKASNKTKGGEKKLKLNETLLPFSVTKAPKKPKVTEAENVTQDKPIKNTSPETVKRKKSPNPIKKSLAKLEGFLELSTPKADSPVTKRKKKAALTKTVAAVKPRKPVVFLRRPPAVGVKYRQDSDTNTDYSDSDASITSPLKVRLLNTLKDSSQNSSPQHASEADKTVRNENITANKAQTVVGGKSAKVSAAPKEVSIDKVEKKQEKNSLCSIVVISSSEDENSETDEESSETGDEFKEMEESISQEVYSSSNEGSESSDSEDSVMEIIPGLEFNLDKGVEKSFADTMPDADNWKIADRDRHNMIGTLKRYFAPRSIQCRNCKADGHMSRDCPQPLKRRCIYCGKDGHSYQVCPNAICFNCQAPGHKFTDCKESKRDWRAECGRCWMPGHEDEHCPDRWRQYHLTIDSDGSHLESSGKDDRNPLVFCYNCGGKGHLGFECRLPRMNQFIIATYPFIARYGTKNKCKERKQDKRDVEVTRKTARYTGDRGHQIKDKKIKQRHGQNKSLTNEHNNAYHRKHSPHNKDEGNGFEEQKRKRQSNQQRKMNKKMRGQSGNSRDEGNTSTASVSRDLNSDYPRQKRKFTEDDMLDDFDNHQVNDNEWWNRNQSTTNTKKRRNTPEYSPNVTGNDWQKNRQRDDSISFQRSQAHRMDKNTPKFNGQWRNNRQQQLEVQEREEHVLFSPQFKWAQNNDPFPRNYENRPRGEGQVSNYTHNQRANSFDHKASRRTHLQQASSSASFHKNNSNLPSNRNGFHARNDRFVAMKRNCDITIQIHK